MVTDKKARSDKAVGDGAGIMVLRAVIVEQPWMQPQTVGWDGGGLWRAALAASLA